MPLMPAAFLVDNVTLAFALLIPTMMLTTAASSVQGTALQLMAPPRMRGRVIAIYLLFVTLVGMGIGPLLIGVLSDHLFTAADGLQPAMAIVALAGLVIAAILHALVRRQTSARPEEHPAELQSLMRISYAVLFWEK